MDHVSCIMLDFASVHPTLNRPLRFCRCDRKVHKMTIYNFHCEECEESLLFCSMRSYCHFRQHKSGCLHLLSSEPTQIYGLIHPSPISLVWRVTRNISIKQPKATSSTYPHTHIYIYEYHHEVHCDRSPHSCRLY